MISAVTETSEASINEVKFHNNFLKLRYSQKNDKFGQERIF